MPLYEWYCPHCKATYVSRLTNFYDETVKYYCRECFKKGKHTIAIKLPTVFNFRM